MESILRKTPISIVACIVALILSSMSSAQLAHFDFDGTLGDSNGSYSGTYIVNGVTSRGTPEFVGGGVQLGPDEGIVFPPALTSALLANSAFSVTFRFQVTEPPGGALNRIFSLKESRSSPSPGISFNARPADQSVNGAKTVILLGDTTADNTAFKNFQVNIPVGEWREVTLAIDFSSGTWSAFSSDAFIGQQFEDNFDLEAFRNGMEASQIYLGWIKDLEEDPDGHSTTIIVNSLTLYDGTPPADLPALTSVLEQFTDNLIGIVDLSDEDEEALKDTFLVNYINQYASVKNVADSFLAAYESTHDPFFMDHIRVDIETLSPVATVAFYLQQEIHDTYFIAGNIENAAGIKFEAAEVFPGSVADSASRVNGTVEINASYAHDPAVKSGEYELGAYRPTGYYAAAGELVSIRIDPNYVNAGLQVNVGAHVHDMSRHKDYTNRFFRVSKTFDLDSETTLVANPFGGGLYLVIPDGADLGWIDVTIEGAVKSPYYSYREGRVTDAASWKALESAGRCGRGALGRFRVRSNDVYNSHSACLGDIGSWTDHGYLGHDVGGRMDLCW